MSNRISRLLSTLVAVAAISACSATAFAQTITEFPVPSGGVNNTNNIVTGPDGAIWFTETTANKIGRITTAGSITEFSIPTATSDPRMIVAGPDGALWFAESNGNKIGRITTAGAITEFGVPTPASYPFGIALGPDNNLWFTEFSGNKIGRLTTAGVFTEFPTPTAASGPVTVTAGPDGNIWFTEQTANKIGKVTMAGVISEVATIPTANSQPIQIIPGPDGALWFAEDAAAGNKIGRITTAGAITEFPVPTANAALWGLTVGPDGAIWFAEVNGNKVGRMTMSGTVTNEVIVPTTNSGTYWVRPGPDGNLWFGEFNANKVGRVNLTPPAGPSPLVASILPASRSVQTGNFATVFATIANATSNPQTGCRIEPSLTNYVPGFFSYQTTNPATNALSGTPNTSAPISAQGLQTYVLAFKAGSAMPPQDVKLVYICDGVAGVTPIVGVNTWLLTFSDTPVADMIAVGVTPSNDGFAHTGGNSGTGVFAVATTNIGPATALTAKPRLSDTSLPLTVTICETDASANCKAPPAATVSRTFNNNEASSFALFVKANGAVTPDPATKRLFLEFLDGGSVVRGSTSTAVTTQ